MKTLKKVSVRFKIFEGSLPLQDNLEPDTFYISKKFGTASHKCLGGCGGLSVTPLSKLVIDGFEVENESIESHKRLGIGWNLVIQDGNLTLTPSVLNIACNCHYIITNGVANLVHLCER